MCCAATNIAATLGGIDVVIADAGAAKLKLGVDESYQLIVGSPRASLKSETVYGAVRGLETFSQLVDMNSCPEYLIRNATVSITDTPRFPWRGLMMDLARHFFSLSELTAIVDQMAQNKLVSSNASAPPWKTDPLPVSWVHSWCKFQWPSNYLFVSQASEPLKQEQQYA